MRRFAVVLLSDGRDTTSLSGEDEVLELARRSDVSIQAVYLPAVLGKADPLELGRTKHFLTTLTGVTGGQTHFPVELGDLEPLYGRIAEGLRAQYSLAYVPENARADGRWRQIAVVVRDRGGVSVRHKPGYYAPEPPHSARRVR
jgi:VWFA-related protein